MKKVMMCQENLEAYRRYLIKEEKEKATIEKYIRDVLAFYRFLPEDNSVTKERVIEYKENLKEWYKVSSANSMLVSLNGFFSFMGWEQMKVKGYKSQRNLITQPGAVLEKLDYQKLLGAARSKRNSRLYHIVMTICATGIRISELQFITLETVEEGQARVCMKGKTRTIVMEKKLRRQLLEYCRSRDIHSGPVFVTKGGLPVDRSNIWTEMKKLSREAGVEEKKVYPHNLRHLFARTYYKKYKDIVYLADILGHSNINTTRIYTSVSVGEHEKILTGLGLVI